MSYGSIIKHKRVKRRRRRNHLYLQMWAIFSCSKLNGSLNLGRNKMNFQHASVLLGRPHLKNRCKLFDLFYWHRSKMVDNARGACISSTNPT